MKVKLFTYFILGFCLSFGSHAQIEQDLENKDSILSADNKNEFQLLFFKALSNRGIENYEKAVETLEKLLLDYKDKPELHFQLGLNYFSLEQYNLSIEQLEIANKLKPNNFDIKEAMFKVFEQSKEYDKAIETAEFLAQSKPEYFEVLSNIFLITKQYQKALNSLGQADDKLGFDAHRDMLREVIYDKYNKPEAAINYYQNRINLESYNPLNKYRLIKFLMQDRKYELALKQLKLAQEKHRRFTRFSVLEVQIYLELNNIDKAFKALETVVKDRFLEEKYKVQAIENMKTYIENNPEFQADFLQILNIASQNAEDASSYLDLGLYYFKTDKPKALDNFKKALQQNPKDFQIWKNIALLEYQLQKYEASLKTSEKALDIFPTQAVFMVIKGQSYLKLAQYNEAKTVLLEASNYIFEENDLMLKLYQTLSLVFEKLNNLSEANNYNNKAKEIEQKLK